MKYIFLDIDGVVNTISDKELILNTFEKNKLERVIALSKEFDARIIIISDRRILKEERFQIDFIFDSYLTRIDYLSYIRTHKNRSDEILYFLDQHKTDSFVILDDIDLGYSQKDRLKYHFVCTYKRGFDIEEYEAARAILRRI